YDYLPGSGVLVSRVDEGGGAYLQGLQRGDLIRSVNGRKVSSIDDLGLALKEAGSRVVLEVQRGTQIAELPPLYRYGRTP
ncbi:MAG: PDZ domain-containing protein, partial [Planctomycetota bacterium]|nr:PDZ domain-containing protein [Planctomycetota bacterium]